MADKIIRNSKLDTFLSKLATKLASIFWRKGETIQVGIDDTPTANSSNLVTSGGVFDAVNGQYIMAWDGASSPVAANIPAGVSVVYNGVTTTGTLAASVSTRGKIYLVSDGNGQYDRYYTSYNGSAYSWAPMGSTAMDLSILPEIGAAEAAVDLDLTDEQGNVLARFADGGIRVKNFDSSRALSGPDLSAKSWCSLGTSITWYNDNPSGFTKGYQGWMLDKLPVGNLINAGVNGGSLLQLATSMPSIIAEADIYTIEHGVNDWGQSNPVGTIADYTGDAGATTFFGAYRKVIDYIYTLNPHAIIILITPRKAKGFNGYLPASCHDAKNGIYLSQYADAVRQIADYESLFLCDWYNRAEVNDHNLALYSIDDAVHPNDPGYQQMAQLLLEEFKKIY